MKYNMRVIHISSAEGARQELAKIGCDPAGIAIMADKARHRVIKLENVPVKAANLLKQTILAKGGEAAVAKGVADFSVTHSDVLLMGTLKQLNQAIAQLKMQPWGLPEIAAALEELLNREQPVREYVCGDRRLVVGRRTLVMGILNVTPDSFSDGGQYNAVDRALARAQVMVSEGADIIDIGAESTRPYGGATPVEAEEELARLMPVLKELVRTVPVPVSVDTYKARVAEAALAAGAHMINDVWGLKKDPEMARVVAAYNAPVVVMHNKLEPGYGDLMGEVLSYLNESIAIAQAAGIPRDKLIVDPGIGFGKTAYDNLEILRRLEELKSLGCPILLGTSRKSFIGKTLDLPVNERVEGTAATVALGVAAGADIIRVHDVKEMVRVARMTDAIVGRGEGIGG